MGHWPIIELWLSERMGDHNLKQQLEKKIKQAVLNGELKAVVLIGEPGTEEGLKDGFGEGWKRLPKERWQFIGEKGEGFCDGRQVNYWIHRDDFLVWLVSIGEWPLPEDCWLNNWWAGPTLGAIFKEEPDYQELERIEGYLPLPDAICYAIGVYPDVETREKWSFTKSEDYDALSKRATGDILSDTLGAKKENKQYWISKYEFYKWVKQQGVLLSQRFLMLELDEYEALHATAETESNRETDFNRTTDLDSKSKNLNREEKKKITKNRHQYWADVVKCCREKANHIVRDNLSKMSESAAKKILEDNNLTATNADPYYKRYFGSSEKPDVPRLAETIRRSDAVKETFPRSK